MTAPPRATTLRYDEVEVDDELPPLELPITPTVIIAGAIASRDFQDVHHDRDLAVKRGSKDIFMNILTTNGYVGRFVTDWAGPEGRLRSVDIRLGAPNYPGDTMKMTGRVKEKRDGVLTIEIVGDNSLGNHVTGAVTLELPREGSA
jgi:acyl dehydratase